MRRSVIIGALVALALVGGCSGGAGDSCRGEGDCSGDLYCRGPNDAPVCGIAPRQECASDTDCSLSMLCHAVADGCSADGIGSECGPPCAGTCEDGFRCNATGGCEPIPCDEGFSCPAYQDCDTSAAHASGPVYDLTHGCVSIACSHDATCPAGTVCTNSVCQSGPGTCREVQLVP